MQCPICDSPATIKLIDGEKALVCTGCGAHKDINSLTGNTIWLKNGRIVYAEEDINEARKRHKKKYGYV